MILKQSHDRQVSVQQDRREEPESGSIMKAKLHLVFGEFILGLKKQRRKACKLDCLFSIVSATSVVAEKLNIQDHSLRLCVL